MAEYEHLFRPLTIRGRTLRNRIVTTPHATGWEAPGGLITDKEADYLIRKARGGVGLLMTFGSATVDPNTTASYGSIALWDERNEPLLRRIAAEAHEHGAVVISQATHMGHRGSSKLSLTPVRGVSDTPEPDHREVADPLTVEELKALQQRFVDVALRLQRSGWDGMEVTSWAHLIEQFWNPAFNQRTDEYGGSLENRMRFGKEVVRAVREAVGEDFIVGFRMSIEARSNSIEFEPDVDVLREIAISMAETGDIDILSVCVGDTMTRPALSVAMGSDFVPEVPGAEAAARITPEIDIPVLLTGRILRGDTAEEVLASGTSNLVGMTRAIIADPDLPQKLQRGEPIRECIGINQGCIGRLYTGLPIICSVNPAIRDPQLENLEPTGSPKHVVVVGGGVAGLEAARHAAQRGHRVALLEQGPVLGGRAWLNAASGWRPNWMRYLDYLESTLADLGATIRLGTSADAASVLALEPDSVIVSTGSEVRGVVQPPEGSEAVDADTVIASPPVPRGTRHAVIIDDESAMVGVTAARSLSDAGWRVTIVTPLASVAAEVDDTLIRFVHEKLEDSDVEVVPDFRYQHTNGEDIVVEHVLTGRLKTIEGPSLVAVAGHRRAKNGLRNELLAVAPGLEVRVAGDARAPRNLDAASGEGALVGASIA